METAPLLFDLGKPTPTTREIADRIRLGGGAEALTEATRRADAARYQEVHCRSALNPVKGMPFEWTLNPYRGCTHGCHYCYARRYHTQFELGADDEFASVIFVKTNFVDVLRLAADEGDRSRPILCAWKVLSPTMEPIASSCGIVVQPEERLGDPARFHYLVVVGGLVDEIENLHPDTVRFLERAAAAGVPLVGVCTGTFALHRAGLMQGYRACVSWFHHEDFLERFDGLEPVSDQIFVVDRDPNARKALEELLGDEGYDVRSARDLEGALESIAREPPCLVLAEMPGSSAGTQDLRARLRTLEPAPSLILMSSRPPHQDMHDLPHLQKPIELTRLYAVVDAEVTSRRSRCAGRGCPRCDGK